MRVGKPAPRIRLHVAALATALWAAAALAAPSSTFGSCMEPPPLQAEVESAEILFTGTVVEASNDGRWATVAVDEVWRGPDQAVRVVIRGGPEPGTATSVDRSFELGVRYLFFPYVEPGTGLADNSCTSTQPWVEELEKLRPDDARQPIDSTGPTDSGGPTGGALELGWLMPLVVAAVVFASLLGVGLLVRGRSD